MPLLRVLRMAGHQGINHGILFMQMGLIPKTMLKDETRISPGALPLSKDVDAIVNVCS